MQPKCKRVHRRKLPCERQTIIGTNATKRDSDTHSDRRHTTTCPTCNSAQNLWRQKWDVQLRVAPEACSRDSTSPNLPYMSALPLCHATESRWVARRTKARLVMRSLTRLDRYVAQVPIRHEMQHRSGMPLHHSTANGSNSMGTHPRMSHMQADRFTSDCAVTGMCARLQPWHLWLIFTPSGRPWHSLCRQPHRHCTGTAKRAHQWGRRRPGGARPQRQTCRPAWSCDRPEGPSGWRPGALRQAEDVGGLLLREVAASVR